MAQQGDRPFVVSTSGAHVLICDPSGRIERPTFAARRQGTLVPLEASNKPCLPINVLTNADFSDGTRCWSLLRSNNKKARLAVDFSKEWTLSDGHTAYIRAPAELNRTDVAYVDPAFGEFIPLRVQTQYRASGYFAPHRCDGRLSVELYDKTKKILETHSVSVSRDFAGGQRLEGYGSAGLDFVAPAHAAFAKLLITYLRFPPTVEEGNKGHSFKDWLGTIRPKGRPDFRFLFFTHLFFGFGLSPNTEDWAPLLIDLPRALSLGPASRIYKLRLPGGIVRDSPLEPIDIVDESAGVEVQGSPIKLDDTNTVTAELDQINGTTLHGWASWQGGRGLDLEILIDGATAGIANAERLANDSRGRFHFRLPADHCDGRMHHIKVLTLQGRTVAQTFALIPGALTSWEDLQTYAGPAPPAYLNPSAKARYMGLLSHLTKLAGLPGSSSELATLNLVHDVLVKGFRNNKTFLPLAFPHHLAPDVSIVIPVHNKFEVTYHCLAALLFASNKASFEVIVVDDGSTDRTVSLPELVENINYRRNEVAKGFVHSCNLGAEHARGRYIVLLNNDTEPLAGWLDELLFAFKAFPGVGLAGAKLLYPDGRLQEAGGIVWANGDPWNYGRAQNAQDPRFNYTRQTDYLSGAAIMILRDLWQSLGGFSAEFAPAYFEDTDLAFKVRERGFKTVYVPLAQVIHFEGMSHGTATDTGIKRYQEINRPKFKRKWAHAYVRGGEEGKNPDLVKDRNIIARALMVDYTTPRPDIDAGGHAAIQEMRLLQSLGFKVTFVPENLAYLGRYTDNLQRLGTEVMYTPFVFSISEVLQKRGSEFQVIYVTRHDVARRILPDVRKYAPQAKVLLCNADLHFLRDLRMAMTKADREGIQAAIKVRDQELEIMRQVNVTLSYNEVEHAVIRSHNLDTGEIVQAPWVVDTVDEVVPFSERRDIAFLGGFNHIPNVQAVRFFVDEIMPLLRKRKGAYKLRVYGSNMPSSLYELSSPDVILEGYVDDLADVYGKARIFVAPLLSGAGLKGKVIGAMSHGIPSILSPVAAEGTGARHGFDCMIALTPDEWVQAIELLYENEAEWNKLSRNAIAHVDERYSFEKGRELMRKALEAADIFVPKDLDALYSLKADTNGLL